jgi:hypothetical protein
MQDVGAKVHQEGVHMSAQELSLILFQSFTIGLLATGSGLVFLLVLLLVFKVSHLSIAQVREQGPRTLSWWCLLLSLSLIILGS